MMGSLRRLTQHNRDTAGYVTKVDEDHTVINRFVEGISIIGSSLIVCGLTEIILDRAMAMTSAPVPDQTANTEPHCTTELSLPQLKTTTTGLATWNGVVRANHHCHYSLLFYDFVVLHDNTCTPP